MSSSLFLSLREGVSFSAGSQGELLLEGTDVRFVFKHIPPGLRDALEQLAAAGAPEDRLAETVLQADGVGALAQLYYYLHRLTQRGLLLRSARHNGELLATLRAISPSFVFADRGVADRGLYVVSRFMYARREGGETVLESPRAQARITVHDWRAAALVHALGQPRRAGDVGALIPGLPAEAAQQLLALLAQGHMLTELDDHGVPIEDMNPVLQSWEFHDLLFHSRSRQGRHDSPTGGTYRFAGRLHPPPALVPARPDDAVELYRPDLDRVQREDPPFAHVQETRRSIRDYADRPLTIRQLGEFLYRVGRVKAYAEHDVETPHGLVRMDFATRPYPGGGALYELELYAAVNACEDLASGLYHYEPLNHRLERLSGPTADVERLLQDASWGAGIPAERLQVLLIIAARFQRVAWKYASMAYALTLKHVGVLYQTMYLAATAMGLAPCGVGDGDADLFARAAGTDYYAESSVGEFLLGSKG